MTGDRRARERHLAGEPRAGLARSAAADAAPPRSGRAVPGRGTLTGALGEDAIDPAATVERQLAAALRWLDALAEAERDAAAETSSMAASRVRAALRLAERALAAAPSAGVAASAAGRTGVAALERRVAEVRDLARPWLARAFTPSEELRRRVVAGGDSRELWAREVAAWRARRGARPASPAGAVSGEGAVPAAGGSLQREGAADPRGAGAAGEPWEHLIGEASEPVNLLGRVQAPRGRTLRQAPAPDSAPIGSAPLPFDAGVMVVRRTRQPAAAQRWCYVVAPDHGVAGFCEERYLALDPPEPRARLHRAARGDTLGRIARAAYGEHITASRNERLYVQGLYEANKGRAGIKLTPVALSVVDTWHRREAEEETLKVYLGVQVLEGMSLWVPSVAFMHRLEAAGAITSGSSELTKAWRAAAAFVDDSIEGAKYAAGFVVGMLEGAWQAIVDLFAGALELVEAIAKVLYHLITGNPGRIKDMLMRWADRMRSVWEQRGALADAFLQRWNAPSGWDRGLFQGEVLGWAMMTVLLVLATMGAGAAANASSLAARYPRVAQLLRTVDVVGDVGTHLGGALHGLRGAGRLPAAATEIVRGKLGSVARAGSAGGAPRGHGPRARAVDIQPAASSTRREPPAQQVGHTRPRMQTTATALDGGGLFEVNFLRDLSPRARSLVRKIEKQGFVRVSDVSLDEVVQISKWFDKEIAVVQSPYGRLRIVLGTRRGVLGTMLKRGEVFVLHTHPVMRSSPDHFVLDLARAGKHVEAVIDWNGLLVLYSKSGILNPRNAAGWLEPLRGYEAAFLDGQRRVVGFAKIDIIDGPQGTDIKVRE